MGLRKDCRRTVFRRSFKRAGHPLSDVALSLGMYLSSVRVLATVHLCASTDALAAVDEAERPPIVGAGNVALCRSARVAESATFRKNWLEPRRWAISGDPGLLFLRQVSSSQLHDQLLVRPWLARAWVVGRP